jgi:hypothetical protein
MAESLAGIIRKAGHGATDLDADGMMARVHVYRVHSAVEQVSVVRGLPAFLAAHPAVRLLGTITDSVTVSATN